MKKIKLSKKAQRILSVLLLCSILISSAFAFLSASESKSNVFNIGQVNIVLKEYFDANNDGVAELYNEDETPQVFNNVLPGQTIEKSPFVVNTGDTDAFVYLAVGLPTAPSDQIWSETTPEGQSSPLVCGEDISVPIKAFAIQRGYNNLTNAASIWNSYVNSDENGIYKVLNEAQSADNNIQLFQTVYNPSRESTEDINWNTEKWSQIGGITKTIDASGKTHNYYIFAFKGNEKGLLPVGAETNNNYVDSLFTDIRLINKIGDGKPLSVNYYAPVNDNSNVLSATSNDPLNLPENYALVNTKEVQAGDTLDTLYFEDKFSQSGYMFSWKNAATNSDAFAGMTVTDSLNLIADYNNLTQSFTNTESADTSDYLMYWINYSEEFGGLYADVIGAVSTDTSYPSKPTTVVVPNTITATYNSSSSFTVMNGYYPNGLNVDSWISTNCQIGTEYTIPVKTVGTISGGALDTYVNNLKTIAQTVILPDSIVDIGDTFSNSDTLLNINVPFSCPNITHAFNNDSNLQTVMLPASLKSSINSFDNCSALEELTVPASVEQLEESLSGCLSVLRINISDLNRWVRLSGSLSPLTLSNATVDEKVYHERKLFLNGSEVTGEITLNNSVNSIYKGAFYGTSITKVTLPDTVTSIGESAFEMCTQLAEINIPAGVTTIGNNAFAFTGLANINIQGANNIGSKAFYNCPVLTTALINAGTIGNNAFSSCANLNTLTLSNNVTSIGESAFASNNSLTQVFIPVSVTSIGSKAFAGGSTHNILYDGTAAQLSSIILADTFDTGSVITCSDSSFSS